MFWKISDPKLFCSLRIDDKLLASQLSKSDFFSEQFAKKRKKKKDSTVQSAIRSYFLQKPSSHVKSQWWLKAFYDTT